MERRNYITMKRKAINSPEINKEANRSKKQQDRKNNKMIIFYIKHVMNFSTFKKLGYPEKSVCVCRQKERENTIMHL